MKRNKKDNKFFAIYDLVRKTSQNSYTINHSESTSERYMYALIRGTVIFPDDVFIPANMKDKVKVLQRIRFIDAEPDYGSFLSNVYLIRISLRLDESIPIYLTYDNSSVLDEHYVIYRPSWSDEYYVTKKLETYIYINKNEYISLSEV